MQTRKLCLYRREAPSEPDETSVQPACQQQQNQQHGQANKTAILLHRLTRGDSTNAHAPVFRAFFEVLPGKLVGPFV